MQGWKKLALVGVGALVLGVRFVRRKKASLQDKVVVITGGSRGLGLVLAREFGALGAKLALIARDEAELQRAAGELRRQGCDVSTWALDLTADDGWEIVLEKIRSRHGSIDVLINNAGEIVVGPFERLAAEDFRRSLAVHLWAPLRLTRAAIPIMRRQGGGRIANIASIGGRVPVPHLSAYCAGKFALVGLSGTLRSELAKDHIIVTTVCPGLMRTGSHWNAIFKGDHQREFAWFGHGASLPGASISAERAARQIVAAIQRGDAELTIAWQAQAAVVAAAVAPALVAGAESLAAKLLPAPRPGGNKRSATGWQSRSRWMPSFFTRLGDRAASRNNELRDHASPI